MVFRPENVDQALLIPAEVRDGEDAADQNAKGIAGFRVDACLGYEL